MSSRKLKRPDDVLGTGGLRELRLLVPDARSEAVRQSVREQSELLSSADEKDALRWVEAVSIFDERDGEPSKR